MLYAVICTSSYLSHKLKLYIDNNLVIEERNSLFSKAKSLYYEDSLDIEERITGSGSTNRNA